MTIKDFFIQFPIQEPKFLTNEDLISICLFTYGSSKLFNKNEDRKTEVNKIDSFKKFCVIEINKRYENLDKETKIELDKFINFFSLYY